MDVSDGLDLDAIETRTNAATPGPWKRFDNGVDNACDARIGSVVEAPGRVADGRVRRVASVTDWAGGSQPKKDADFIAAARTDVPTLIAEIRRLRELALDG